MEQNSRQMWLRDLAAGMVVFLVALPLCLGIALASGAPLQAGLITGIVAGIVVGWLSGSQLSVSGPAAGLTVIVATAITELGSFEAFATCVVISGVFQIIFSLLKAGVLSGLFPNAVIKGMLAAIGLTIILKQIPHALGRDTAYEGILAFWDSAGEANTFSELIVSVVGIQMNSTIVSLLGLGIMIGWPKIQKHLGFIRAVPAALMTVVVAILVNEVFNLISPDFGIRKEHLVQLPVMSGVSDFFSGFALPSWQALIDTKILMAGLTIAIVGSIETLLCIEATDRLDPHRRVSNTDQELLAQGTGNIIAGLLGGLPMTSVIVRSSANVYAGATSRFSAIFHGIFLFLSIVFLSSLLNRIPLAALAAILLVVGYKLTPWQLYKDARAKGTEYFVPFLVTILAILFTDLLKGVGIGLAVGVVFVIKSNHYGAITMVREKRDYLIKFTKDVSFANKVALRKMLKEIPRHSRVLIDGSRTMFIDNDIYDMITDFQEMGKDMDIQVSFLDVKDKSFSLKNRRRARGPNGFSQTDAA